MDVKGRGEEWGGEKDVKGRGEGCEGEGRRM